MVSHQVARVEMWGQTVGALAYQPESGLCAFEYDPSWIRTGIETSPIRLPLSSRIYQFPALPRPTYRGLPGAFADTLPDDFGNAVIDAWLARTGRARDSFTALERLLYTGSRGMGALEYAPAIDRSLNMVSVLELDSLVAMAQSVLDQRRQLDQRLQGADTEALSAIFQVGTSAGGARAKAVIGINASRTEIRSGQVAFPTGFEHYLLKFDGVVEQAQGRETFGDPQGFGRMEYAYYLMAKAAGIQISPCELLLEGERAHFMTKRFDRDGNQKVHYQSLCAMDHADYKTPGSYSYEQLFSLMRTLRLSKTQALELYRRMVFNILARNQDDHTKNFAFIMDTQGEWRLAPAYDVCHAYRPGSAWVSQHALSINGKRQGITRDDLLEVGRQMNVKKAPAIVQQIAETVAKWHEFAEQVNVESKLRDAIGGTLVIL